MSQSETLPMREPPTTEKRAPEANLPLLTQYLEDQQLAERVERALRARGYWGLHSVRVSVNTRVVLLEGQVSSYYLKQLAQATALAVPGAHQIRNDLEVVQPK
jgi:osmotically-inducible protein OsmY